MAATSSPKKFPRGQPKSYSTCLLYNAKEASKKLQGLAFAACNPKLEKNVANQDDAEAGKYGNQGFSYLSELGARGLLNLGKKYLDHQN